MFSAKFFLLFAFLAILGTYPVLSYQIPPDAVIWGRHMTVEEGIQNLEQRIVNAIAANPNLASPRAGAPREFFEDLASRGRFRGELRFYSLTGADWNSFYGGELRRIQREREAAAASRS